VAPTLFLGIASFLPALAIVYFVLGAQEEFFRHQAMFVAMIGGLVLGLLVAIVEWFVLSDASVLFVVLAFPLVETMAKTMLVGLPRFRDRDETILLGGAAGAMMAAMLATFYVFYLQNSQAAQAASWQLYVKVFAAAVGFTGAHFVSGLRLGLGPARGSITSGFFASLLWLLPAHLLLGFLGLVPVERGLGVIPLEGSWVTALILAVYGIAVFVWKTPAFIERGLPRDERRKLREEGLF
jgi:hypothetical protein